MPKPRKKPSEQAIARRQRDRRLISTIPPLLNNHCKRSFGHDYERELLIMRDDIGLIEFPLAELNGRLLVHCMLKGLATILSKAQMCPRTYWMSLKAGYLPPHRGNRARVKAEANAPPQPLRPLSNSRQAIVEAMMAYPHCRLSRSEAEAAVRQMLASEVRLWNEEPDVRMHFRELGGKPTLRIGDLVGERL